MARVESYSQHAPVIFMETANAEYVRTFLIAAQLTDLDGEAA